MIGSVRRIALSCVIAALLLWAWFTDTPKLNQFAFALSIFLAVFFVAVFLAGAPKRRPPA
jgi:hypothetical protein